MATTVLRSCNLCEAGCGLKFEVEDNRIVSVQPDEDDPLLARLRVPQGHGHRRHPPRSRPAAPPGAARRRTDVSTRSRGTRRSPSPARGCARSARGTAPTPSPSTSATRWCTTTAASSWLGSLLKALGTRNRTSAGSQDTSPRFAASYYLYGNTLVMPVPDIDRTDYFLCIGANPAVSQGSAMVTPNVRARLRAIRERGGKVVTVDPRFTETAKLADEHVFIRPGGDAAFLLAMLHALVEAGRVDRDAVRRDRDGMGRGRAPAAAFSPERTERADRHRRRA